MKVAVFGSRGLDMGIDKYIPNDATMIISGNAQGIDKLAQEYAIFKNIKTMTLSPEYDKYGTNATLVRNKLIVDSADVVVAI